MICRLLYYLEGYLGQMANNALCDPGRTVVAFVFEGGIVMKKAFQRNVAIALCFATATTFTFTPPAVTYAASQQQDTTQQAKPFSERYAEMMAEMKEAKVQTVVPGHAYIPKGTVLQVELTQELSSKRAKVGDAVPLKLVDNVIVNDVVVIPAGTEVEGVVTKARKAGGLGRGGKLEFSITGVKTINNVKVPLDFTKGEHGAGDAGGVAVFAAVSIVGGLFMKGKNVIYNPGLKFDAEVTTDTDLNAPLEKLAEVMDASKPHGTVITIQQK